MMLQAVASHSLLKTNFLPTTSVHKAQSLNSKVVKAGRRDLTVRAFELAPPPYELDALEPHLSKTAVEIHWGRHHRTYVEKLNDQTKDTELASLPLEEVIKKGYNGGSLLPYFNNAAQIWNHDFLWESIAPNGGGKPSGELLALIERDFGSYEAFDSAFRAASATLFGSGWAWLVAKSDNGEIKLAIETTSNAVTPIVGSSIPILTIDVWEHAYYVDYQNKRPAFIETYMTKLVNWKKVEERFVDAKAALA